MACRSCPAASFDFEVTGRAATGTSTSRRARVGDEAEARRARFSSRRYINLVAKHHLVDRLQAQSRAFVRGLAEVVDPKWLRMFARPSCVRASSPLARGRARLSALDDPTLHARSTGGDGPSQGAHLGCARGSTSTTCASTSAMAYYAPLDKTAAL